MTLRTNSSPPKGMTWVRATPVLVLCAVFDITRAFFSWFWLLGPVVAAAYCTAESGVVGDLLGTEVTGALCSAASAGVGYMLSPALFAFGVFVAMLVGLAGWMTVGLILVLTNPRIFKENATMLIRLIATFGIMELPFVGALPALTLNTWHMYRVQIRHDKKRVHEWRAAEQARLEHEEQARLRALEAEAALEEQAAADEATEASVEEEEARLAAETEAAEREAQEKEEADRKEQEEAARAAEERKLAEEAALVRAREEAERELADAAQNRYHDELMFARDVGRVVKLARARRRQRLQQHTIKESYEIPGEEGRVGA